MSVNIKNRIRRIELAAHALKMARMSTDDMIAELSQGLEECATDERHQAQVETFIALGTSTHWQHPNMVDIMKILFERPLHEQEVEQFNFPI